MTLPHIDLNSVGYKTDLIFNQYDGTVVDRGDYIVATTTSNPNYFWGNLLIYKKAPVEGDLQNWKEDFRREITHPATYHMTFGWDSPTGELGNAEEFIQDGFKLAQSIVLTATATVRPPKYNPDVIVKPVVSDEDFETSIHIQVASGAEHLSKKAWEDFSRKQMTMYRRLIGHKRGQWFGAYLKDELVGGLGIFSDGDLGRYQVVSTHPDHQRKGVCATLVYHTAKYAFETMKLKKLVMVADEHYHAAKIYESVGFAPTEKLVGVSWYDKSQT